MREDHFDYIIAGGGLAGLSLAYYLNESDILRNKRVLIADRDAKNRNDRTWCFWEKEESVFEPVVCHSWDRALFHGPRNYAADLDLGAYRYKMIRALDFYEFVRSKLRKNPSFVFLQTEIDAIRPDGVIKTGRGQFTAREYVFDSATRKTYDDRRYRQMRQHFLGWVIRTPEKVFTETRPTLFDFRVGQMDECRFVYILPFAGDRALVEYTIFSDNLPPEKEYRENLQRYLEEVLQIRDWEILETERGVIPMSDEPHEESPFPRVVRIGTAGGYVKPSTGYSFRRTQLRLRRLVRRLEAGREPRLEIRGLRPAWKGFLDSVLLDVLLTKKHPAADVFTELFRRNQTNRVLKFLDEETSLAEDLRVMRTVPAGPFARAALQTLFRKLI